MEAQAPYGDEVDTALAPFRESDAAIAKMREQFAGLKIAGLDDKAGFDVVHDARMSCVRTRSAVEKTRKALKADALEYGRKVDGEAARLEKAILEIEAPLRLEEERVVAEKARIAREAEERAAAARKARLDERVAKVTAYGPLGVPVSVIESMSDEQFAAALEATRQAFEENKAAKAEFDRLRREATEAAKAKAEAEAKERQAKEAQEAQERAQREAAEAEARKAEAARIAQERAALEAQRLEQQATAKRLADERAAVEAEARRLAAKEAAAKEASEREKRERDAQERLAVLAPELERVEAYLAAVLAVPEPDGDLGERAGAMIAKACEEVRRGLRQ